MIRAYRKSVLIHAGLLLLLLLGSALAGLAFTPVTVSYTAPNDEEFVGPFASWRNVKTAYGAVGDGIADDTAAIQTALNELRTSRSSGWSVLYFPAGTYKITATLTTARQGGNDYQGCMLIGEDPATTVLSWAGAGGQQMLKWDGWYTKIARLAFEGNNLASAGLWKTGGFSTCNELVDLWFRNVVNGIFFDGSTNGQAEQLVMRCRFDHCSGNAVVILGYNTLDIWVWNCLFTDCTNGIRCFTGGFSAYNNVFIRSGQGGTVGGDIGDGCGGFFPIVGNTSIDSRYFLGGSQWIYGFTGNAFLKGNRIYDTTLDGGGSNNTTPIKLGGTSNTMMDNTVAGLPGATSPVVMCTGASILALDNTYTTPGWAMQSKEDRDGGRLPGANAFDNNATTSYYDPYVCNGDPPFGNLYYIFAYAYSAPASRKTATSYTVTSAAGADRTKDPKDWTLQATNDFNTWTTLDTQAGQAFAGGNVKNTYPIANTTAYCAYRLHFSANQSATAGIKVAEVELKDGAGVDQTDAGTGLASSDGPHSWSPPSIWNTLYALDDAYVSRASLPTPTTVTLPGAPVHTTRTVFEVTAGANAATIQAAIDSAAAAGNRAVVHLPMGAYNVGATLVVPANADIQLIGDGGKQWGATLNWTGTGAGPVLRITGPSHCVVRDIAFQGYRGGGANEATAVQIANGDQDNGEVFLESCSVNGQGSTTMAGEAAFNLTGNDDTNVTVLGSDIYSGCRYGVKVAGGPKLTDRVASNGRFASICNGASNFLPSEGGPTGVVSVQNGGKAAHEGVYIESDNAAVQALSLVNTRGQISLVSTRFSYKTSATTPTFTLAGYDGEMTMLGCQHENVGAGSGEWFQLSGNGNMLKALAIGSFGNDANDLWNDSTNVWQDATAPAAEAAYFMGPVCNIYQQTLGATPGDQFIRDRIAFSRSITALLPQPNLASDVTAVRFYGCTLQPGKSRYGLQVDGPDTPCAVPFFTPDPGPYAAANEVTISTTTPGAAIHYTTDGSTPTQASLLYTGPLTIAATTTIKAIACKSGFLNSAPASGTFTINIALTQVRLQVDKAAPQPVGAAIRLTGIATGGTRVQFRFRVGYVTNGIWNWTTLRGYGTYPSSIWTPAEAHTYTLQVWAKETGSTALYDKLDTISYAITPALSAVSVSANPASPQRVNTAIVLTATKTGGATIQYQYRVGYTENGAWYWSTIRPYGLSPTCTWHPTTARTYTIQVWAREVGALVQYQAYGTLRYTINP